MSRDYNLPPDYNPPFMHLVQDPTAPAPAAPPTPVPLQHHMHPYPERQHQLSMEHPLRQHRYQLPLLQQHELEQQQHYQLLQQQHLQPLSNPNAAPMYEVTATTSTAAASAASMHGSGGEPSAGMRSQDSLKPENFIEEFELRDAEMQSCSSRRSRSQASGSSRKRKLSSYSSSSGRAEMDCGDSSSSFSGMVDKRQNHSEIEKRRRDKMNYYISELSSMIPMCGAMCRKLDKLTVLRMTAQHLRNVRCSLTAGLLIPRLRPAFVSERELNDLILQTAGDAFLFVVSCDRGRLLYVSQSVNAMLHYEQKDLLGQSMFNILHPKDVAKMKEQLSFSDLGPRERLIDAKTMLPVKSEVTVTSAKWLCPGARRSFFCRIKCKQPTDRIVLKEENEATTKLRKKTEKKYCVVQCTGYLKSGTTTDLESSKLDEVHCSKSCLVAIARAHAQPVSAPPPLAARALHYVSRHAIDGKFLFVDQRVTLALGFLPQELLGTSLHEYVSAPALNAFARAHKQALLRRDAQLTPPYSFRRKDGSYATLQTHIKPFRNPWTKDVECLVAKNSIVSDTVDDDATENYDAFSETEEWRNYLAAVEGKERGQEGSDGDARANLGPAAAIATATASGAGKGADDADARPQSSGAGGSAGAGGSSGAERQRVEVLNVGSTLAQEEMSQPPPPAAAPDLMVESHAINPPTLADNILGVDIKSLSRNNVPLMNSPPAAGSPSLVSSLSLDGSSDATMAVIMSLLEADAGLGGPVNFSGLPWPLP